MISPLKSLPVNPQVSFRRCELVAFTQRRNREPPVSSLTLKGVPGATCRFSPTIISQVLRRGRRRQTGTSMVANSRRLEMRIPNTSRQRKGIRFRQAVQFKVASARDHPRPPRLDTRRFDVLPWENSPFLCCGHPPQHSRAQRTGRAPLARLARPSAISDRCSLSQPPCLVLKRGGFLSAGANVEVGHMYSRLYHSISRLAPS